jgi:hypothetical protein
VVVHLETHWAFSGVERGVARRVYRAKERGKLKVRHRWGVAAGVDGRANFQTLDVPGRYVADEVGKPWVKSRRSRSRATRTLCIMRSRGADHYGEAVRVSLSAAFAFGQQ